jgi:membrane protein implicated in regulation of membrane protease activity
MSSLSWWVGVVIVGIVLNVVAAYLKPLMDRVGSRTSTRWKSRTERLQRERNERIAALSQNTDDQILTALNSLRYQHESSFSLALATNLMALVIMGVCVSLLPEQKTPGILGYFCSITIILVSIMATFSLIDRRLAKREWRELVEAIGRQAVAQRKPEATPKE